MATVIIKTVNGRQYRYLQRSYWVPGRLTPKTESIYLGPVGERQRKPKRRRLSTSGKGNGITPLDLALPFMMAYDLISGRGVARLKEQMSRPSKARQYTPRESKIEQQKLRQLDALWAIDKTSKEAFRISMAHMSAETLKEYHASQHSIRGHKRSGRDTSKKDAELQDLIREFNARHPPGSGPSAPAPSPDGQDDANGPPGDGTECKE